MYAASGVIADAMIALTSTRPGNNWGNGVIPPVDVHRNAVSLPPEPAFAAEPPTA